MSCCLTSPDLLTLLLFYFCPLYTTNVKIIVAANLSSFTKSKRQASSLDQFFFSICTESMIACMSSPILPLLPWLCEMILLVSLSFSDCNRADLGWGWAGAELMYGLCAQAGSNWKPCFYFLAQGTVSSRISGFISPTPLPLSCARCLGGMLNVKLAGAY